LISGAAFNSAVLSTLNVVATFIGNKEEAKKDFEKLFIMIIAQFSGVIVFAMI